MKLFSHLVSFVLGGMSMAAYAKKVSRTQRSEDKLDRILHELEELKERLERRNEQVDELADRLVEAEAREAELQKMVERLTAKQHELLEASAAVTETAETPLEAPTPEEVPAATTQPEPETVPEEPPTATVTPAAETAALVTAAPPATPEVPIEVVAITKEKPPTIPKVVELVRQWFKTDKEGRAWHLDQIGRGVRLVLQEDGVCSFPSCPEKRSGAHIDMRDGNGAFPVCRYGYGAAVTYWKKYRRDKRRPLHWVNDTELEQYKKDVRQALANEEVERLASQIAARELAEAAAAAAEQERRDNLHHMEILIVGDKFEAKEGAFCAVPNCTAAAPTWHLYLGRDDSRLRLLCNAHGEATEELRKEQKRKVRRFRLEFWIFSSRKWEELFVSRAANRRADDESLRRDHAERAQERRELAEVLREDATERAIRKQATDRAYGRESHTRIKVVPADSDDKPGDPKAAA